MKSTVALLTVHGLGSGPIDFVSLELKQSYYDHHRVKIVLDLKNIGENVLEAPMDKTSLIHTNIQIDIQEGDDKGNAYGFMGVITDVEIDLDAGDHGWLYIYAASPTIELERGRMMQTYSDTTLKNIFDETTKGTLYLNKTNKPNYTAPIKFSMQYKETDWQYLKRLAWMYGENLFFSGDSLVFGQHDEKPTVKVTYDVELTEVRIGTKLKANTFQQYYHDVNFEKNPYEFSLSEGGTFAGGASAKSDELNLMRKPDMPLDVPVEDQAGLQHITEVRKKRTFTDMYHVTGKTKLYRMRIGSQLEIDFHKKMNVSDSLGTLRIINVRHVFEQNGKYWNDFEAVSAKHGVVPCPEVEIPSAQPLSALVVGNEHPEGYGKLQLQFDFQTKACDYWFPIVMPQGSGHSSIGEEKNVGFVFIPELQERIIVNFFDGNPEFPFVHGSMYHGNNAENQGGGPNNYIKTIITKSGHTIRLDDTKGKEKIQLYDKKGNIIEVDTKEDTINVTANSTINMTAVDINMMAANAITMNAGVAIDGKAGALASFISGLKGVFSAGSNVSVTAGKTLSTSGGKNASMKSGSGSQMTMNAQGNATLKAKKQVQIASNKKIDIVSKKDTEIKSNKTKMLSKAKTQITGRKVDIS